MRAAILSFAALIIPCISQADDAMPHWKVDLQKSSIRWSVNYGGKQVNGSFPSYTTDIVFDPAHLDRSKASVSVEVAKVRSSDSDAEQNLPSGDWFAAAQYPLAAFNSNQFKHISGDNYEADGSLTLRGKTKALNLPFSVKITGKSAIMDGQTIIKRLDFGVGQRDWAKTDTVGGDVKVVVHIEANTY